MRIGIDIRCLSQGRRTGVEEYTINLLENIFFQDSKNEYILFFNSFSAPQIDFDIWKKYPDVRIKIFHYPNKLINFLFWFFHWPYVDKMIGGVDVLFFPNLIFAGFTKNVKVITTVHDLSFERHPEFFSLKRRLWHFFINPQMLCQKSKLILAVSQSTKNDLEDLYKINPQKIAVIPSAVSDNFAPLNRNDVRFLEVKKKYNLPFKFILYLGTIEPRKNIVSIIKSYSQFRKLNHPELNKYKLVIAGHKGWKYKNIFSEISKSDFANDILIVGQIDDGDKPYVYNLASLFVYPSFFEGFGFPPLEAMKCGVPAITSNGSSLPEVVGDGGLTIDPHRPDELFQAMKEVLLSKDLKIKLSQKSLEQAKKFSWEITAQSFLKILNSL